MYWKKRRSKIERTKSNNNKKARLNFCNVLLAKVGAFYPCLPLRLCLYVVLARHRRCECDHLTKIIVHTSKSICG